MWHTKLIIFSVVLGFAAFVYCGDSIPLYVVKNEQNVTCFLLKAHLSVRFNYTYNGNKTANLNITVPQVNATGKCASLSNVMNLKWWTSEGDFQLTFNATKNTTASRWLLDEVMFECNVTRNDTGNVTIHYADNVDNLNKYPTKLNQTYKCDQDNITITLHNQTVLGINNIMIEPFVSRKDGSTNFDTTMNNCLPKKPSTSALVPIIVGACLGGMIVLVLIGYCIGRRKTRAGYQEMQG